MKKWKKYCRPGTYTARYNGSYLLLLGIGKSKLQRFEISYE